MIGRVVPSVAHAPSARGLISFLPLPPQRPAMEAAVPARSPPILLRSGVPHRETAWVAAPGLQNREGLPDALRRGAAECAWPSRRNIDPDWPLRQDVRNWAGHDRVPGLAGLASLQSTGPDTIPRETRGRHASLRYSPHRGSAWEIGKIAPKSLSVIGNGCFSRPYGKVRESLRLSVELRG